MNARVASGAVLIAVALAVGADAAGDLRLIEAVRAKNAERVRALIAERVDVNARQGDQATALHWAAHLDDRRIVDLLLRAGAQADVADDTGATPLYLACVNGNAEVVARLLDAGANAKTSLLERRNGADDVRAIGQRDRRASAAAPRSAVDQRTRVRAQSDRPDVGRGAIASRRRRRAARGRSRRSRALARVHADGDE